MENCGNSARETNVFFDERETGGVRLDSEQRVSFDYAPMNGRDGKIRALNVKPIED